MRVSSLFRAQREKHDAYGIMLDQQTPGRCNRQRDPAKCPKGRRGVSEAIRRLRCRDRQASHLVAGLEVGVPALSSFSGSSRESAVFVAVGETSGQRCTRVQILNTKVQTCTLIPRNRPKTRGSSTGLFKMHTRAIFSLYALTRRLRRATREESRKMAAGVLEGGSKGNQPAACRTALPLQGGSMTFDLSRCRKFRASGNSCLRAAVPAVSDAA